MKATVTNVTKLLRSLHIDATSYFSIEKGDNTGVVVLTLVSSFLYRHDADHIESSLEDNFRCTFRRDKKGNLHMIALTSKEDASNTSQIEEPKVETECINKLTDVVYVNNAFVLKVLKESKVLYLNRECYFLCSTIQKALTNNNYYTSEISSIIPEFNKDFANKIVGVEPNLKSTWWYLGNREVRIKFLDYLINLYK